MAFDPKKFNTPEYVRQIIQAAEEGQKSLVENLLEEYGAKTYRQGVQDGVVNPRLARANQ